MRVLKRKGSKGNLVKEARARQYFSKPSEIKREKEFKERSKIIRKAQKNDELLGYRWVKGVKVKKI